jgi:hypothetical protein
MAHNSSKGLGLDYSQTENVAERIAKRFGASFGTSFAQAMQLMSVK